MTKLPSMLIAVSAAVILFLGVLHLLYTFYGPKLLPRDPELLARMREVVSSHHAADNHVEGLGRVQRQPLTKEGSLSQR